MTQRQLEVSQYRLHYEVTCELNDRFSIVIKRQRHSIQVFLKNGSRRLKLPFDIFEGICNSQVSLTYLKHFLEEH